MKPEYNCLQDLYRNRIADADAAAGGQCIGQAAGKWMAGGPAVRSSPDKRPAHPPGQAVTAASSLPPGIRAAA